MAEQINEAAASETTKRTEKYIYFIMDLGDILMPDLKCAATKEKVDVTLQEVKKQQEKYKHLIEKLPVMGYRDVSENKFAYLLMKFPEKVATQIWSNVPHCGENDDLFIKLNVSTEHPKAFSYFERMYEIYGTFEKDKINLPKYPLVNFKTLSENFDGDIDYQLFMAVMKNDPFGNQLIETPEEMDIVVSVLNIACILNFDPMCQMASAFLAFTFAHYTEIVKNQDKLAQLCAETPMNKQDFDKFARNFDMFHVEFDPAQIVRDEMQDEIEQQLIFEAYTSKQKV